MLTIYGSKTCTWCEQAKQLCNRKMVAFEYVDLTAEGNEDQLKAFKEQGFSTVPQIFDDSRLVGGFQDLVKELGGA